jgi:DNA-directed RNA polymerase specialized sigma24 family protein
MVAREEAWGEKRARFHDRSDIVRALARYGDEAGPRTGSVMFVGGAPPRSREPFHPGVIAGLEERAELARRLRRLGDRDRLLVFLWYVQGWSVPRIAAHLGISRVHCYRVRDRALGAMLDEAESNHAHSASTPSTS